MEASIQPTEAHRPRALTIVCMIGLAWWIYLVGANVAIRFFDMPEALFPLGVPRIGGPILFQGICIGAILRMRQWGVLGYIAVALWYHITYYLAGTWNWWWLGVSLLVIVPGLAYFKRMH
jgi:hypothetical protein